MYEVIINGRDEDEYDQIARDVDCSLEDERWWQDIKRLRRPNDMSDSQEIDRTVDILEAVTNWPIASFQHGRRESKPRRFAALQEMLRKAKKRAPMGDLQDAGSTKAVPSQRMTVDLLTDSDSDTTSSSIGEHGGNANDGADDEAMASESEAAVSGNNFDEYDLDASSDDGSVNGGSQMSLQRSKTTTGTQLYPRTLDLRKAIWKNPPKGSSFRDGQRNPHTAAPLRPQLGATASETAILTHSSKKSRSVGSSTSQLSTAPRAGSSVKPPSMQHSSLPKFTSNPTPRAAVASEEASGPSIMFVDTPSPETTARKPDPFTTVSPSSNPTTDSSSPRTSATIPASNPATGFPAQRAIPLSFNDLPCRAQHLILNELLRQQSDDTAVVFTTLPSPIEGTCESDAESVKYVSDLEVLCQGLPPVLLVHSNSMTVTMNL